MYVAVFALGTYGQSTYPDQLITFPGQVVTRSSSKIPGYSTIVYEGHIYILGIINVPISMYRYVLSMH